MKPARAFTGIKKNVVVLSVTSLLTDISSEMLYPIIPIFLTSVLGAPMSILGLIEGAAEAVASVLKAFSGYISDLFEKRKPFVIWGYSLSALGKLLFFLAYSWPFIFLARVVDRIGKGVRTSPRDAMIADSCEAKYRGKVFGFHRAMDTIGACLGPLLAFWLLYVCKDDLRSIFLIALVPALAGVGILIFWLKEGPHSAHGEGIPLKINIRKFSPTFWKFIFISTIFAIGNSSDAFLIMRAKDIGLTTGVIILAYVVYNISYSALSLPAGVISDRLSRKTVMVAGYLIFAFVYTGFGAYVTKVTIWPLFFIYGFYIAMTDGISKAFVADVVGKEVMGTAIGLYYCITGFAAFFASLIAGLLWTHIGSSAPFIYGAAMAVISSVAFLILL
ncbi:MAG: MFS transporter [Candidatus Omnitrophica bacterium]|nr:MFS transporter [Candidatus Omnitrophota bacterium]